VSSWQALRREYPAPRLSGPALELRPRRGRL